jgi:uncharacterized protein (DUF302 family)
MVRAAMANEQHYLQTYPSSVDHATTVERVEAELGRRGLTVYARFDHAANAASVGLTMEPAYVIVFGNPAGGTPVMQRQPELALDLPLRILIRQSGDEVLVQYRAPAQLVEQFGLPSEAAKPFQVIADIATSALAT